MRTLRLNDAKASFSTVVKAAERGHATIITKHGRPAAVVMPVEDARRLHPADRPSFAALLMSIPHAVETARYLDLRLHHFDPLDVEPFNPFSAV